MAGGMRWRVWEDDAATCRRKAKERPAHAERWARDLSRPHERTQHVAELLGRGEKRDVAVAHEGIELRPRDMRGQVLCGRERHLAVLGAVGDQGRHPDRGQKRPDVHVGVAVVEAEHGLPRHLQPSLQAACRQIRHVGLGEDPADVVAHQAVEVVAGKKCRGRVEVVEALSRAAAGSRCRSARRSEPAGAPVRGAYGRAGPEDCCRARCRRR